MLGLLARGGRIGGVDRQDEGNQPKNAVWDWFCADFEQDLGRNWITFYAAIAAKGVGFGIVLAWVLGGFD